MRKKSIFKKSENVRTLLGRYTGPPIQILKNLKIHKEVLYVLEEDMHKHGKPYPHISNLDRYDYFI